MAAVRNWQFGGWAAPSLCLFPFHPTPPFPPLPTPSLPPTSSLSLLLSISFVSGVWVYMNHLMVYLFIIYIFHPFAQRPAPSAPPSLISSINECCRVTDLPTFEVARAPSPSFFHCRLLFLLPFIFVFILKVDRPNTSPPFGIFLPPTPSPPGLRFSIPGTCILVDWYSCRDLPSAPAETCLLEYLFISELPPFWAALSPHFLPHSHQTTENLP